MNKVIKTSVKPIPVAKVLMVSWLILKSFSLSLDPLKLKLSDIPTSEELDIDFSDV